ncbi:hypothetical protein HID58_089193 [Brassica napus]|uniref:Uncharacterized protein n=1 Tax=Brassica napus TaxID=3708 RepID=A0ABQ7XYB5_BRANA|nr:hypothetical protein HID58_089193 [Brassica napus]
MSGNQQPQISLPTWRYSDFNAAIPIKKRKYFVQPEAPLDNNPLANEKGDTRSALDSSDKTHVSQKMIGEGSRIINIGKPVPSLSVSVGKNAESVGNLVPDQIRVKVEEPINSNPLVASEVPSSAITKNNEEPTALDLSLSKGVCAPHDPDFINSGIHNVVNRSNWDLNTTMDAWEDCLDRKTRVKTTGAFLNSSNNTGCPDMETSTNVIVKSVSEGVKSPTLTLTQSDHEVKSTCSLSLGLGSHPPIVRSPSLSVSTSTSRPAMIAGNVNSVNLRTVKSEVIEESGQVDPTRLSQDVVGRFRQENSLASSSLKPLDSISVKAEPNNLTQSEAFNRKDGTLNHRRRPLDEILDLPTSITPNQMDKYMPSSGIGNALMSLNGLTRNPGVQSYPDSTLQDNPGQSSGHGDHNLNASGVNDKVLDDCKTYVSPGTDELPKSGEEKNILYGKELREKLCSDEFDHDCVNDRVLKKQVGKGSTYEDDEKVQRPVAMLADVPFDGNNQTSNHVEEKESQATLLVNTGYNEGGIVQDGEQSTHQIIHASEGVSGVSTLSGGNGDNPETLDNNSPVSHKAEISTFDDDPPKELSEGSSPRRIKTPLDASDSFAERDRLPDFSLGQRKYSRWSYGNTRRGRGGGAFTFNPNRGRRPADDEGDTFPHSFTRRNTSFSYTQRGPTNKEDASEFHGFRDGERQSTNSAEPMFMSLSRPYRGRSSFGRGGRTNFSNNSKRDFPGYRSRSPVRSRDRSAGPSSSSFRNRSQEDFNGNTDFSHRRSPSGYRTGRLSSPDQSGYPREGFVRRHNSPPYSHRPRGRGYERGRGYARGRGYGRDGISFRKPYDRVVHRNMNNFDPRERVDYSDDFFEGTSHSERFGGDGNAERRQFGYRHDGGTSSFRQSFSNDGCGPTNVENDPDAARFGQNTGVGNRGEQGSLVETDGKNKNLSENASGRSKNMEGEEDTSKHSEIWQQDEVGGGDGF